MQQLYTQSHVTTVFILGMLHGFFIGGLLISRLKSRPKAAAVKSKIPSVRSTEYPSNSKKLLNSKAV